MLSRFLLLSTALALAACASSKPASANAVKTGFNKQSDVIYTPAGWPRALPADLYVPEGDGPWPAVLLVYGGNWSNDDHRWQMSLLAKRLAKRGYVVFNASYRGAPEFVYPAAVDDLREAVKWLRAHAGEHHINPDKIAAYGFSAGGHLVEMLATQDAPAASRVQAVVAAAAPANLELFHGGEIIPRFLGATYAENPTLYREASPVTHVSRDDPPAFLYHGTDDKTVYPQHSKEFHEALDRAGVRNELVWVEGKKHAGMLLFNGDVENRAIDFLDSVLR